MLNIDAVLCFDPGDTTGICIIDTEGGVRWLEQMSLPQLIQWAGTYEPEYNFIAIIYEKFIVFRQKAHTQVGSKMQVSQAIGVIKMLGARLKTPVVEQSPDIKNIALKWTGIKMPSQHSQTHKWDAYLHGAYWLRVNGYTKSKSRGLLDD